LRHATISFPAVELCALLGSLTFCLVFKLTRTGLVVSYLFAYAWAWTFFADQTQMILACYLVFGCMVAILGVIGMLQSNSQD
jgi:hypothetical protein